MTVIVFYCSTLKIARGDRVSFHKTVPVGAAGGSCSVCTGGYKKEKYKIIIYLIENLILSSTILFRGHIQDSTIEKFDNYCFVSYTVQYIPQYELQTRETLQELVSLYITFLLCFLGSDQVLFGV